MERRRPRAVFMAFGTKGDVFPVAALAVAFASDQQQYDVTFITHSAHKNISAYMEAKNVYCCSISSPPVLSVCGESNVSDRKQVFQTGHRHECLSAVESVFGNSESLQGDFIVINFFALEGWSLAELFQVRCVIAAPYVVPYSAPASFERRFKHELPLLYKYFAEAPFNKVSWKDVMHWMWPLFTEDWGSWRHDCLNLSPFPFTDPITYLPLWHLREESPLLLYGFSNQIVECPGYWPPNMHVCGFWFHPMEWQFSCSGCAELASLYSFRHSTRTSGLCSSHLELQYFLEEPNSTPLFVGLSSIGSMGFLQNAGAFLLVLKAVLESTEYRFILLTAGYEPLDAAIQSLAEQSPSSHKVQHINRCKNSYLLFDGRLFCFSGTIPYNWLFPRCAAAIHHGGSGSTAAALHSGIPQIPCPFMLDQFYWAERMCWLGVASEPLKRNMLIPETDDPKSITCSGEALRKAIESALSPKTISRALELKEKIASEDGIRDTIEILKCEIVHPQVPG